jgi:hypothetical protein
MRIAPIVSSTNFAWTCSRARGSMMVEEDMEMKRTGEEGKKRREDGKKKEGRKRRKM